MTTHSIFFISYITIILIYILNQNIRTNYCNQNTKTNHQYIQENENTSSVGMIARSGPKQVGKTKCEAVELTEEPESLRHTTGHIR
jgi:hypothetical protein